MKQRTHIYYSDAQKSRKRRPESGRGETQEATRRARVSPASIAEARFQAERLERIGLFPDGLEDLDQ